MGHSADVRVDIDAVTALVTWKSSFADEVASRARQLASATGKPNRVTLSHYRQAASAAIQSLAATILDGDPTLDDKAA